MSKLSEAADQVLALADNFRAIVVLAEELKAFGRVDQAIEERKATMQEIKLAQELAESNLAQLRRQIVDAEAERDALHATNKSSIESAAAEAQHRAAQIISDAEKKAAEVFAQNRADIDFDRSEHQKAIKAAKMELESIVDKKLAVQSALDEAKDTLRRTTEQVEALKQSARSLLGPT